VLLPDEWRRVDAAINRSLAWLATQQQPEGSFPTLKTGQPGVTRLCVLAFMAHGHNPGEGLDGQQLDRAIRYISSCQKQNGLVALLGPDGSKIRCDIGRRIGQTAAYNHGIASLTLSENYGMGQMKESSPLHTAINKSLVVTLEMQRWPKDVAVD